MNNLLLWPSEASSHICFTASYLLLGLRRYNMLSTHLRVSTFLPMQGRIPDDEAWLAQRTEAYEAQLQQYADEFAKQHGSEESAAAQSAEAKSSVDANALGGQPSPAEPPQVDLLPVSSGQDDGRASQA